VLLCLDNLIGDLTRLEQSDGMVKNRNREQRTPRQSHSIASYPETGMGSAERSDRDGEEPFVHEDSKSLANLYAIE
jgi:hypothetical protein